MCLHQTYVLRVYNRMHNTLWRSSILHFKRRLDIKPQRYAWDRIQCLVCSMIHYTTWDNWVFSGLFHAIRLIHSNSQDYLICPHPPYFTAHVNYIRHGGYLRAHQHHHLRAHASETTTMYAIKTRPNGTSLCTYPTSLMHEYKTIHSVLSTQQGVYYGTSSTLCEKHRLISRHRHHRTYQYPWILTHLSSVDQNCRETIAESWCYCYM